MDTKPTSQSDRLRVVILNQYYVPDVASTGHLLYELAHDLASRGAEVKVITSRPSYGPPETWQPCPSREFKNGVDVTRMRTTRFSKDGPVGRLSNSIAFLLPLMIRILFRRRQDEVFLYTTNPPYLGLIGALIAAVRHHPYVVLLHDSYPQLAVWVGKISAGGLLERVWHRINRSIYARAQQTIVLSESAKKLVCDTYGVEPERVHIVPNWADPDELTPKPKSASAFARENGLLEPFTVLYSGNLGLYYEFETILSAAEALLGENFRLVFVGAGGNRDWIAEQIEKRKLTNTLLRPYQPRDRFNDSLTAGDALMVTIAKGIDGISFPSKLYTSLAVGRPILTLCSEDSELRRVVLEHDVGHWCPLGDPTALTEAIRSMMSDPERCATMGRNARRLLEEHYTLAASGRMYAEVLRLAHPRSKDSA